MIFSPPEEEWIFDVIFLRWWKFNSIIYLPQSREVKISCCDIITPWSRNMMARVNILRLNIHPGVFILYNEFTRGCSYYIISPPGSETLGECKYYLTPAMYRSVGQTSYPTLPRDSPSQNGYLVNRSKVGLIVAVCCVPTARGPLRLSLFVVITMSNNHLHRRNTCCHACYCHCL